MGNFTHIFPEALFSTKEEKGEIETSAILPDAEPVTGSTHIAPYSDYVTL